MKNKNDYMLVVSRNNFIVIFFLYLLFAWIEWNLNINEWVKDMKILFCVFVVIAIASICYAKWVYDIIFKQNDKTHFF